MKLKRFFAILSVCAIATSSVAYAFESGVCTHMSHTFEGTNNPMDSVISAATDVGAKWIRYELVWGYGMQTTKNGELTGIPIKEKYIQHSKQKDSLIRL